MEEADEEEEDSDSEEAEGNIVPYQFIHLAIISHVSGEDSLIWRFGKKEGDEEDEEDEEDEDEDEEEVEEGEENEDENEDGERVEEQEASDEEEGDGLEEEEEHKQEVYDEKGGESENEGLDGSTVTSQKEEMTKATHTRNQLQLWDDIMSIRMLLQPVQLFCLSCHHYKVLTPPSFFLQELNGAVQFPQPGDFALFNKEQDIKNEFADIVAGISTTLEGIL